MTCTCINGILISGIGGKHKTGGPFGAGFSLSEGGDVLCSGDHASGVEIAHEEFS